jgi:hypothetical protein
MAAFSRHRRKTASASAEKRREIRCNWTVWPIWPISGHRMASGWLSMKRDRDFSVVHAAGVTPYTSKIGQMGQTRQKELDFTGEVGLDGGRFSIRRSKNGQ